MEYQEAVNHKKPCFAYIKRARRRDERLPAFLKNDLKQNFKYYEFGNDTDDLIRQLEVDLQNFIVSTLRMGIQARAEKLGKTIALISKEEKSALNYITAQDPLAEAQTLFSQEKYLECLFMTVAIVEATLRQALANNGVTVSSSNTLGAMITLTQKSGVFNDDIIDMLRTISIYRNQVLHLGITPDKEQIREIFGSARLLINALLGSSAQKSKTTKVIPELWSPFPKIKFTIAQRLLRSCNFPQVAWEVYNDSPYQLRIRLEVHPILGGRDLHPLKDNSINGNSVYEAEPNSYFFANGCFTLPQECATSKEDLVLEIQSTVQDINDLTKGQFKLVPKRWKYVRETDTWFYYPQRLVT